MMFKKLAAFAAASAMVLGTTAAQANSASALSLRHAPGYAATAPAGQGAVRAATPAKQDSKLLPASPLFFILGIVGVVAILEVTGAINIFGDDNPDSP